MSDIIPKAKYLAHTQGWTCESLPTQEVRITRPECTSEDRDVYFGSYGEAHAWLLKNVSPGPSMSEKVAYGRIRVRDDGSDADLAWRGTAKEVQLARFADGDKVVVILVEEYDRLLKESRAWREQASAEEEREELPIGRCPYCGDEDVRLHPDETGQEKHVCWECMK